MHETIEQLIQEAKMVRDGKVCYDGEVIKKMNDLGAYVAISNEGVSYQFQPYC